MRSLFSVHGVKDLYSGARQIVQGFRCWPCMRLAWFYLGITWFLKLGQPGGPSTTGGWGAPGRDYRVSNITLWSLPCCLRLTQGGLGPCATLAHPPHTTLQPPLLNLDSVTGDKRSSQKGTKLEFIHPLQENSVENLKNPKGFHWW